MHDTDTDSQDNDINTFFIALLFEFYTTFPGKNIHKPIVQKADKNKAIQIMEGRKFDMFRISINPQPPLLKFYQSCVQSIFEGL